MQMSTIEEIPDIETLYQFDLEGGTVLFFDLDDSTALEVSNTPYRDPFENATEEQLQGFIREFGGKFEKLDISEVSPFNSLIGKTINKADQILDEFDIQCGVQFLIGENYVSFVIMTNGYIVLWGKDNPRLATMKMRVCYS
jgi:hypothetical protein